MNIATEKFERVLEKAHYKRDGNRVRQITGLVAKSFEGNSGTLMKYFDSGSELSRGVATAAYAMITGDFEPISKEEYGGLGIVVSSGPEKFVGNEKQCWYAKGKGDAFKRARGKGESFWFAKGEEEAFLKAIGYGAAFWWAEGGGESFLKFKKKGLSFRYAKGTVVDVRR